MVFVALGILAGLAVTVGPWPQLAAPFDHVLDWLAGTAAEGLRSLYSLVAEPASERGYSGLVAALIAILSVVTPGVIALILALLVDASKMVRNVAATALLVLAGSTVLYLPLWQALLAMTVAFTLVPLLALSTGALIRLPLAALTTVLAVRMVPVLYRGQLPALDDAATTLANAAGVESPLWRIALIVVGLTPFAAAAWRLLGGKAR